MQQLRKGSVICMQTLGKSFSNPSLFLLNFHLHLWPLAYWQTSIKKLHISTFAANENKLSYCSYSKEAINSTKLHNLCKSTLFSKEISININLKHLIFMYKLVPVFYYLCHIVFKSPITKESHFHVTLNVL